VFGRILEFFGAGRLATSGVALSGDDPQPVEHPLRETLDSRYHRLRAAMAADDEVALRDVLTADFVSRMQMEALQSNGRRVAQRRA
jgi:hypothetical protein